MCRLGCDYDRLQAAYDEALVLGRREPVRIQVAPRHDAGRLVMGDRAGSRFWIYVEPEQRGALPASGTRVSPSDAAAMYQLRGPVVGAGGWLEAIHVDNGAGYTRILGADISIEHDGQVRQRSHVVRLRADFDGSDPTDLAETPHHIVLDRSFIHLPVNGTRNAPFMVGLYGRHLSLVDSHVIGGGQPTNESAKAVNSSYAPGPLLIENNYLASPGINFFLGQNTSIHNGWVPADITFRRNHVHKPEAWFYDSPGVSLVKNSIQFKAAERVLVECNHFENNWADGQSGTMFLLRSETDGGVSQDLTIRYNRFTNSPSGYNFNAIDGNTRVRAPLRRVSMHNNVWTRIGAHARFASPNGSMGVIQSEAPPFELDSISITHNTFDDLGDGENSGSALVLSHNRPMRNFVFRDNLLDHGNYGVKSPGNVEGSASLESANTPADVVFDYNVCRDCLADRYPGQANRYPQAGTHDLEFEGYENDDLRLRPDSRWRAGGSEPPFDGRMRGADVASVDRVLIAGPSPSPRAQGEGPRGDEDGGVIQTNEAATPTPVAAERRSLPRVSDGRDAGGGVSSWWLRLRAQWIERLRAFWAQARR